MSPRIVVVTTSFPRDDDDPAGHFVRSHARALARSGADVHVIAPLERASRLDPPLVLHATAGASLFRFPGAVARARQNPLRLAAFAPFAAGALRVLRDIAPVDRLVAHWIVPCAWPILAAADGPLDVVSHGADVRLLARMPRIARESIVSSLIERGARFQFVAAHLLDTLAGALSPALAGLLRAASRVEAAPIELPDVGEDASRLRATLELRDGERLAVCAGRLVPPKRFHLAIAAAAELAPRMRVLLVGDGPERARLESLAAASGVRLTATGALPRSAALAWIAAADVLVHPSAHEGAPTVVREARALGTQVVACAAGDVERWAAIDPGIAIAAPDGRAIAAAVRRAAAMCGTPS